MECEEWNVELASREVENVKVGGFTDVQNYVKNVEKYGVEVEIMFKKWGFS